MRLNTSDPAVHREGVGTSDEAAHSGTYPCACSADCCETRIAVEASIKHRGQWSGIPLRPYPPRRER